MIFFADCGHLNCFVKVAKSSVEKYIEETQLSNLYDIGMKFAAFIYDVSENTGYSEFYSKCKSVLDTLKKHPYLINNLVNTLLEIFQSCMCVLISER